MITYINNAEIIPDQRVLDLETLSLFLTDEEKISYRKNICNLNINIIEYGLSQQIIIDVFKRSINDFITEHNMNIVGVKIESSPVIFSNKSHISLKVAMHFANDSDKSLFLMHFDKDFDMLNSYFHKYLG